MDETLQFLAQYGVWVLFANVFIEQAGLPIPATPMMLAAGALARDGRIDAALALGLAALGSLLADLIWFRAGRKHGSKILSFFCRISMEPDSCVRKTTTYFTKYGMGAVVMGKFVPGLSTVMPPLAGIYGVKTRHFILYDALGSLLYTGTFMGVGVIFAHQLGWVFEQLVRLGNGAFWVVGGSLATYIAYKYIQRKRILKRLEVARITVEELRKKQEAGEPVVIMDLRSKSDLLSDPFRIPGSQHLHLHQLEDRHSEIPRDREVVLYCSCPNEATSAYVAFLLFRRGVKQVRPLLGGLAAWREQKYPIEPFVADAEDVAEGVKI